MRVAKLALVVALIVITGCTRVTKPIAPKAKLVTQRQYIRVPDALTQPCAIEQPRSLTVAEAVRVAGARKAALEQCNRQLDAIRQLGKPR